MMSRCDYVSLPVGHASRRSLSTWQCCTLRDNWSEKSGVPCVCVDDIQGGSFTKMIQQQPVDPQACATVTFDWGAIKWFVSPERTEGAGITFGEVVLLPGKGHDRHNHPESEEILYVLSGTGDQMIADEAPFPIAAGATIYVPIGVYHSTINTGWEPLRMLALYNPGGPEKALESLPDFRELAPGQRPIWMLR